MKKRPYPSNIVDMSFFCPLVSGKPEIISKITDESPMQQHGMEYDFTTLLWKTGIHIKKIHLLTTPELLL